jgi:hypothetical protein
LNAKFVLWFSLQLLFLVTFFILRRIEWELHSNLYTCDWALPCLLSSSADPRKDSIRLKALLAQRK